MLVPLRTYNGGFVILGFRAVDLDVGGVVGRRAVRRYIILVEVGSV